MNYETDIQPRLDAGKDNATIASEINAERQAMAANYRPVKSTEVTDWLAGDGMVARVGRALSALPDESQYDAFLAAWDGVKAVRDNVDATLRVAPSEPHRQLIDAAIAAGIMTQSDLDRLMSVAYHGKDETAETVQAAIND